MANAIGKMLTNELIANHILDALKEEVQQFSAAQKHLFERIDLALDMYQEPYSGAARLAINKRLFGGAYADGYDAAQAEHRL